jgi:hypothetical protein
VIPDMAVRRRNTHFGRGLRFAAVAVLMVLASCGAPPEPPAAAADAGGWHEFKGSWNASGSRRTIALGAERRASLLDLTGFLLLAGPSRPGVGFRAQVIGLADNATGLVGRAVWTDEHGDQVFSELRGQGTAAGNRITGTFLGGTGRYAGADGTYEFSWKYVLEAEDGTVQGSSEGLAGRVRAGQPPRPPRAQEAKP